MYIVNRQNCYAKGNFAPQKNLAELDLMVIELISHLKKTILLYIFKIKRLIEESL